MNVITTDFEGLYILQPKIHADSRGYFFESYNRLQLAQHNIDYTFVQDNEAKSNKGVLRGLHYQMPPYAQTKLVRVVRGSVLDVVVDIRPSSATYGQHMGIELSEENKTQFLIPHGFAHGYLVLEDDTIFSYKCDNFYNKESEGGINYACHKLDINWADSVMPFLVSEKDLILPSFGDHKPFE
jgi:dTDP-4-dehydrorhamnose 3,5-epimerase